MRDSDEARRAILDDVTYKGFTIELMSLRLTVRAASR
jgi:hypothetical protein